MHWVALFSQTGSEINRLARELGRWPNEIYTNNLRVEEWKDNINPWFVDEHISTVDSINNMLRERKDLFITLHGYLRIIPSDICHNHNIYNGHPGLITLYPELKGKDPQEKLFDRIDWYPHIGSVVHKCTPELDGGKIVSWCQVNNSCKTREDVYNTLKDTSLLAWKLFLKGKLNE